jgi:hypothetical protein
VRKDGEFYYRPLGRNYYVKVMPEFRKYYKPRPIYQVLDSLTGLVKREDGTLLCKLEKKTFKRWTDKGKDGYFLLFEPSHPHIPVDEMTTIPLTYYPFNKDPKEAKPIR